MNEGFPPVAVALAAFLHHIAAFGIVAALVAEFALLSSALTARSARQVQIADLAYGIAAGVVLAVGFFRVFYFEKGSVYYFHSAPFIAKITIFAVVGLASIYPTVEFLSWGRDLKQGRGPSVPERKIKRLRTIIAWELAGLVLMILCAALMARGIGFFG
jgi:putative membrane protein